MSWQIRVQADDFFRAYQVLEENYETATLAVMGPAIVNLAFAVELHIKALHYSATGKVLRGHNILALFKRLPNTIREQVFNHEAVSQNPFMTRGDDLSVKYFSKSYTPYERFTDQMKTISKAFEQWRYSYEHGTLNYDSDFAENLIEAVRAIDDRTRTQRAVSA
jgi:HEPN domain-containing protein